MKSYDAQDLAGAVEELLGAGRVGLYEFVWALRSEGAPGTLAEWKIIARHALDTLLAQGDCHLARMHWPGLDEFPLPPDYLVTSADFDDIPEDGWYLAVTPNA